MLVTTVDAPHPLPDISNDKFIEKPPSCVPYEGFPYAPFNGLFISIFDLCPTGRSITKGKNLLLSHPIKSICLVKCLFVVLLRTLISPTTDVILFSVWSTREASPVTFPSTSVIFSTVVVILPSTMLICWLVYSALLYTPSCIFGLHAVAKSPDSTLKSLTHI